ncbi:heterogeneous nuclear ribonucleoprotein A1-like [Panicum virgatum]|uniref:heterogeneous nuclear ribonucleoprotein A1-like n=1 Tax=Panicum virgatum TaxID=38727 RepID=UPI0019D641CB|nr:heterogeneous nuclear ribonucleoprotein A1-like [Panicum virgatum]
MGGLEGARGRRRRENGAAEVLTGGAGGLGVAELWRARVYGGAAERDGGRRGCGANLKAGRGSWGGVPWGGAGVIPGEMFGRQLRERDPEEEDGPGVWGRAGSGKGKGDAVRALGSWQAGQAGQWGGERVCGLSGALGRLRGGCGDRS